MGGSTLDENCNNENIKDSTDFMANKTIKNTSEKGTELTKITVNGMNNTESSQATTCTPEVCRSARQRYQPPDLAHDSPWNQKKSYFFIGTLIVFVIWIIIYTIISQLKLV